MPTNKSLDSIHTQKNQINHIKKEKKEIFLSSFFSYLPKRKRAIFSLLLFSFLLTSGFFFFQNNEKIKGATYGWIQSNWSGGQTANTATHTNNQENWTEFASKDANIVADENGVSISGTSDSWVTTSDEDWNAGTNGGIYVSGGTLYSLKPPGAVCSSHSQCAVSFTCSTICLPSCSDVLPGFSCGFNGFAYIPIVAKDGKVWLDRNLGATRAATSSNDTQSYGWLYQWGRGSDGHQIPTSFNTGTLSNSDVPGHSYFIVSYSQPYDWRSTRNNSLWNGLNGINNPCPPSFRLPTSFEWQSLVSAEGITNINTAFTSILKLPSAGSRGTWGGLQQGGNGDYWSGSSYSDSGYSLAFTSGGIGLETSFRANGFSVRCLKN